MAKQEVLSGRVSCSSPYRQECHDLLLGLKITVEGLLALRSNNVWNTYGGLERVHKCVEKIIVHRLKVIQDSIQTTVDQDHGGCGADFWPFVRHLRRLNPMMAPYINQLERGGMNDAGPRWLTHTLTAHDLSAQLVLLVNSRQHLLQNYHTDGYLCQPDYFQAMLVCLRAIELNDPALLAEVNPIMLNQSVGCNKKVSHNRSSSLPLFIPPSIHRSREGTEPTIAQSPSYESTTTTATDWLTTCVPSNSGHLYESTDTEEIYQSMHDPHEVSGAERMSDPLMNFYATSSILLRHRGEVSAISASVSLETLTDAGRSSPAHSHDRQLRESPSNTITSKSQTFLQPSQTGRTSKSAMGDDQVVNAGRNRNTFLFVDSKLTESFSDGSHLEDISRNNRCLRTQDESSCTLDAILNTERDVSDTHSVVTDSGFNSVRTQSSVGARSKSGDTIIEVPSATSFVRGVTAKSPLTSTVRRTDLVSDPMTVAALTVPPSALVRLLKTANHNRSTSDVGVTSIKTGVGVHHQVSGRLEEEPALSSSLPTSTRGKDGRGHGTTARSGGFFRQPQEGQSLKSFLSSQDFHTCTDLDRENAHFSIAEALIAAIEQMKWDQMICPGRDVDECDDGDSDEEIQQLRQRIRIRRTERQTEKARQFPGFFDAEGGVDAGSSGSVQSDTLPSFESLSEGSRSSSGENCHDTEITDLDSADTNLVRLSCSGLSLSMASLYSDADNNRRNALAEAEDKSLASPPVVESLVSLSGSHVSADNIAIALLKRFSSKQLPKASELVWLVSEQDAPQKLLPLPESYPISPDDGENSDLQLGKQNRIRGNLDWAPPRAQIISSIHPKPKKKKVPTATLR